MPDPFTLSILSCRYEASRIQLTQRKPLYPLVKPTVSDQLYQFPQRFDGRADRGFGIVMHEYFPVQLFPALAGDCQEKKPSRRGSADNRRR